MKWELVLERSPHKTQNSTTRMPFSDPETRCYVRFRYCSQHATKFFAKKRKENVGQSFFARIAPPFFLPEAYAPSNFRRERRRPAVSPPARRPLSLAALRSRCRPGRCFGPVRDDSPLGDHQRQGHEAEGGGRNKRRSRAGRDGAACRRSAQDSRLHRPVDTWEGGWAGAIDAAPSGFADLWAETGDKRNIHRAKMMLRGWQRKKFPRL